MDTIRKRHVPSEWWTLLRAQLAEDVPYENLMQGDTPYLTVVPLAQGNGMPEEFEKMVQDKYAKNPTHFNVSLRVCRADKLNHCIRQIQEMFAWKTDEEQYDMALPYHLPSVTFGYEKAWGKRAGYYYFEISGNEFILPPTEPAE